MLSVVRYNTPCLSNDYCAAEDPLGACNSTTGLCGCVDDHEYSTLQERCVALPEDSEYISPEIIVDKNNLGLRNLT